MNGTKCVIHNWQPQELTLNGRSVPLDTSVHMSSLTAEINMFAAWHTNFTPTLLKFEVRIKELEPETTVGRLHPLLHTALHTPECLKQPLLQFKIFLLIWELSAAPQQQNTSLPSESCMWRPCFASSAHAGLFGTAEGFMLNYEHLH